jgi:GH24 family phage-related lysozyme (muramidase)
MPISVAELQNIRQQLDTAITGIEAQIGNTTDAAAQKALRDTHGRINFYLGQIDLALLNVAAGQVQDANAELQALVAKSSSGALSATTTRLGTILADAAAGQNIDMAGLNAVLKDFGGTPVAAAAPAAPATTPAPVAPASPGPTPPAAAGATMMSAAGLAALKTMEGIGLDAYDDATGNPVAPGDHIAGTLTIGYGHTGKDVFPGLHWTQEQADQALVTDTNQVAGVIAPLIKVKLTPNQFSAFVCFAFNIGTAQKGFAGSTALRMANQGNLVAVPDAMRLWTKTTINGQKVVSSGLVNRRESEIALWNRP